METFNLVQGTEEWLAFRAENCPASEYPAVCNKSKFTSRTDLMMQRKYNIQPVFSDFMKEKMREGHRAEAAFLKVLENITGDSFYPVTGRLEGTKLTASFDGLNMDNSVGYEHKLYNKTLLAAIHAALANRDQEAIPETYRLQLDQQLLVSRADFIYFCCSDGTEENSVIFKYYPDPDRLAAIAPAWEQYLKDEAAYMPEDVLEVVQSEVKGFPVVKYEVKNTSVVSNIDLCLEQIRKRAAVEIDRPLETDQDYADKEQINKAVKKARADMKALVSDVKAEFSSLAEFESSAAEIDKTLQKMQSSGEKQVKAAKDEKKDLIIRAALLDLTEYASEVSSELDCNVVDHVDIPDFYGAIKNKKTLASIQNAVDSLVAEMKIIYQKAAVKLSQRENIKHAIDDIRFDLFEEWYSKNKHREVNRGLLEAAFIAGAKAGEITESN